MKTNCLAYLPLHLLHTNQVCGWNCEFFDDAEALQGFGSANKEGIAELLFSFFDFFAWRHDYNNAVISIRMPGGGFKSKASKGW